MTCRGRRAPASDLHPTAIQEKKTYKPSLFFSAGGADGIADEFASVPVVNKPFDEASLTMALEAV